MKKENLDLSVSRYNRSTCKLTKLYEWISTFEEAHLLALKEMNNNKDDELVVILPGWNLSVDEEVIRKQEELAKKHKVKYR